MHSLRHAEARIVLLSTEIKLLDLELKKKRYESEIDKFSEEKKSVSPHQLSSKAPF